MWQQATTIAPSTARKRVCSKAVKRACSKALDGEVIDGDGTFGGPSRVFTGQQGPRFAIGA